MTLTTPRSIALPSGDATYLEDGRQNARTVLLLHGGGLDCARLSWRRLMPALSPTYRVIAPNWPGYAGTTAFGKPYTIDDIGNWLITFLDRMKIERASLVGVSMGGGAALWSAINHPERIEALAPVATYGVADRAPYHLLTYLLTKLPLNSVSFALMRRRPKMLRRALEAIFADPRKVTPELLSEVREVLLAAGNGAAFSHFQRGEMTPIRLRSTFLSELPTVKHPTLFIHGRGDALVPLAAVETAVRSMRHARLEVMEAGHWPMRENSEEFNRITLSFLETALE